jgi:glycosyltransferase involved in cell wall biosynthesis
VDADAPARLAVVGVSAGGPVAADAPPSSTAIGESVGGSSVAAGGPLRLAVVGVSAGPVCGAHDHALLLAAELEREGVSCSLHWLERRAGTLRASRAEVRAWTRTLAATLQRERPDAVLLHYSVFAYAHRGLPVFVTPVLAALRQAGIPTVTVLHEFVYPWRHGGARGKVWALSQRALLIAVMRRSAAVLLTTDFRLRWLESRPWLPRRPAAVAPVFSNLPSPRVGPPVQRHQPSVGLFGYSYQGAAISLVLDAVALLTEHGVAPRLVLLGAPGRASKVAQTWLGEARARGIEQALDFSDRLPAQLLANALAACDLLLFADAAGPSSRKGTLAASLASGRAVLAIDGPRRWQELVQADAAAVVAPTAQALADGVRELLADDTARVALGARGRRFAQERMGVARTAAAVQELAAKRVLASGGAS